MPQLDIRNVFAVAEDEFAPIATSSLVSALPAIQGGRIVRRGIAKSEWANISFVTFALIGGLFSAFYFFNGADVLQAAARWSREFLYPQPAFSVADTKPVTAEGAAAQNSAGAVSPGGTNHGAAPFTTDFLNNIAKPITFAPINGIGFGAPITPTSSATAPSSLVTQLAAPIPADFGPTPLNPLSALTQPGTIPRGADNLFQALYQSVSQPSRVARLETYARRTVASSRKKAVTGAKLSLQRTLATANSTLPSGVTQPARTTTRAVSSATTGGATAAVASTAIRTISSTSTTATSTISNAAQALAPTNAATKSLGSPIGGLARGPQALANQLGLGAGRAAVGGAVKGAVGGRLGGGRAGR